LITKVFCHASVASTTGVTYAELIHSLCKPSVPMAARKNHRQLASYGPIL
jgi:hypothetical protein